MPLADKLLTLRCAWVQASKQLASAGEAVFQGICTANKWAAPRRPRGSAAVTKHFPWRSLYRHATCYRTGVICFTLCREQRMGELMRPCVLR